MCACSAECTHALCARRCVHGFGTGAEMLGCALFGACLQPLFCVLDHWRCGPLHASCVCLSICWLQHGLAQAFSTSVGINTRPSIKGVDRALTQASARTGCALSASLHCALCSLLCVEPGSAHQCCCLLWLALGFGRWPLAANWDAAALWAGQYQRLGERSFTWMPSIKHTHCVLMCLLQTSPTSVPLFSLGIHGRSYAWIPGQCCGLLVAKRPALQLSPAVSSGGHLPQRACRLRSCKQECTAITRNGCLYWERW